MTIQETTEYLYRYRGIEQFAISGDSKKGFCISKAVFFTDDYMFGYKMPLFTIQVTKVFDKDAIDCGRPTPLGNPFVMRSEQDRDLVCDQYEEWFNNKIEQKDQAVLNQLRGLFVLGKQRGHLKIGCYCAPKRCHLDTVARFLRNYAEKG